MLSKDDKRSTCSKSQNLFQIVRKFVSFVCLAWLCTFNSLSLQSDLSRMMMLHICKRTSCAYIKYDFCMTMTENQSSQSSRKKYPNNLFRSAGYGKDVLLFQTTRAIHGHRMLIPWMEV